MKVFCSGGLGFQGTHLTKKLIDEGHTVYVLNVPSEDAQKNLTWLLDNSDAILNDSLFVVWGSVTDSLVLERCIPQVDVVFHLAAKINVDESIENPNAFFETNILGTYNILNWCLKTNTRIILASSCEVTGGGESIDENTVLNPKSPYAASKVAAERIAYSYNQTYGLSVDIVRPFNVYGPLQKDGGKGAVIAIFMNKILNGEMIQIHGDGSQGRDFVYVDDVINGYMNILYNAQEGACRLFTFGTGVSTSVNEIVRVIEDLTGLNANKEYVSGRKGQVTTFIAKNSLSTYFGNDIKMTSFVDGMRKYYEFTKWV